MLSERWIIAIRKRQDFYNYQESYNLIKNTWRYWCADPFLVDYEDKTYIFAEMYDRLKHKGVIGYCEVYDDMNCSKWKPVIEEKTHLSYPMIFKIDNKIYMIPESSVSRGLFLYKAVDFPEKWKMVKCIKSNISCVDTTLFEVNNKRYIITLQCIDENNELILNQIDDFYNLEQGNRKVIYKNNSNSRPAGHIFYNNDKLIRPSQDCSKGYGGALNFNEIFIDDCEYKEKVYFKLTPKDITNNKNKACIGIHTYNQSRKYEVIDLKEEEFDVIWFILRPFYFIGRRIKRLFMGI